MYNFLGGMSIGLVWQCYDEKTNCYTNYQPLIDESYVTMIEWILCIIFLVLAIVFVSLTIVFIIASKVHRNLLNYSTRFALGSS